MEATKTKKARAKENVSMPNTSERKSKATEYWEKYPNGCGQILDYRAVLK